MPRLGRQISHDLGHCFRERNFLSHPSALRLREQTTSSPIFRFENAWMHMDGFKEFVEKNWEVNVMGPAWTPGKRNLGILGKK